LYAQVRLERFTVEGWRQEMVSYVPLDKAVRGAVIGLRDEDGNWSRGWRVMDDPVNPRPFADVHRHSRDYRKTRQASDI
jgi:hypothetical protein